MKAKIKLIWEKLSSGLWFVPSLLTIFSVGLSQLTLYLDRLYDHEQLRQLGFIWVGGTEGAREVLSTVASSTIGVAGVTFSITVVTLSLASTQFGPRLLRNFLANTGNQIVLGILIGTYLYCLMILRTIRSGKVDFIPWVSVTLAILLAVFSLAVIIYFIHNISRSIQAPEVISSVGIDVNKTIDVLYPSGVGHGANDDMAVFSVVGAQSICSKKSGYVQNIDGDGLMALACKLNLQIKVLKNPGDYVISGQTLALVLGVGSEFENAEASLKGKFYLGTCRTPTQDLRFALEQLVEVAVRALSPGTNDPFTAVNCVDQLGACLRELQCRTIPSTNRCDEQGNLRVVADVITFAEAFEVAFGRIKFYGREHPTVLQRIDEVSAVLLA